MFQPRPRLPEPTFGQWTIARSGRASTGTISVRFIQQINRGTNGIEIVEGENDWDVHLAQESQ